MEHVDHMVQFFRQVKRLQNKQDRSPLPCKFCWSEKAVWLNCKMVTKSAVCFRVAAVELSNEAQTEPKVRAVGPDTDILSLKKRQ